MAHSDHSVTYLSAAAEAVCALDPGQLDEMAGGLAMVRERGSGGWAV